MHPLAWIVWLAFRLLSTFENHSGFEFRSPLVEFLGLADAEWARHHDDHHSTNTGNFGSPILDLAFSSTIATHAHAMSD